MCVGEEGEKMEEQQLEKQQRIAENNNKVVALALFVYEKLQSALRLKCRVVCSCVCVCVCLCVSVYDCLCDSLNKSSAQALSNRQGYE